MCYLASLHVPAELFFKGKMTSFSINAILGTRNQNEGGTLDDLSPKKDEFPAKKSTEGNLAETADEGNDCQFTETVVLW